MHILYATAAYRPSSPISGANLAVSCIAEALVRRGHSVTVFTTDCSLEEDLDVPLAQPHEQNGVQVWYFRRVEYLRRWLPFIPYISGSTGFFYAPRMAHHLHQVVASVDLVHTNNSFVYPTYAAAKAARRLGKPLFYHQRGALDPEHLKYRSAKKRFYIAVVERPIMRDATALIALTEAETASYRALGVTTPCRIVPNGVDVSSFRQEPSLEFDTKWRMPAQSLVILFLGRLVPSKGVEKLLHAFLSISAQFPDAMLVIAGPDVCGLEKKYRKLACEAGLADRIVFPGMVSGERKLDLLARADLFCLPSIAEGFSLAVLEALASATPVLISPGCHFPQVQAVGAGRIVSNESNEIAKALAELLSRPHTLRLMGERGRALVAREYSWDRITNELIAVYREGLQHRKAESRQSADPTRRRFYTSL